MPEPHAVDSNDLDLIRAERDELRRELGNLRARLSVKLGLIRRPSGPHGITILGVASDHEIIAKVDLLVSNAEEYVASARAAERAYR